MTATAEAPAKRAYIQRSPQEQYERAVELLEQTLYRRALVEGVKAARLTAQVAYELGGPEAVVRLLYVRLVGLQFEDLDEREECLALYTRALNTAKLKFRAASGDPSAAEAAAEARRAQLERRTREQHQQWAQQQAQHRQRIANSLPAKPPMSTNHAALEASFAAPAAEDHEPSAGGRSHCRKAKGECGQRLAHKIDLLLAQVQAEETAPPMPVSVTPLQWERSHGEVDPEPEVSAEPEPEPMPEPEPASAAPPSPSGAGEQSADASAISSGGAAGGFTLREGEDSAWGLVCGIEQFSPDDLQTQADYLNERPELRSSALLAALCRAQAVLAQTPADANPAALVGIPAGDLLTMTRALMGRLR
jgi:hypothetical protein